MKIPRPMSALLALIVVYALAQLLIAPMLARSIDQLGDGIAQAPRAADGSRGPIVLRGSSICSYVVAQSNWRRWLGLALYPQAALAGDRLRQSWRIEYVPDQFGTNHCQRAGPNEIKAWKIVR